MRAARTVKTSALLLAAAAFAAILAGSIFAGHLAGTGDPESVISAIREDAAIKVADIPADRGRSARGVFVHKTSTGHLCVWDAPSATSREQQGGCNSADDPLGGKKLFVSLAYDGGPSASAVTDARLIGLGAPNVAAVEILMIDGTRRSVALRGVRIGADDYRAFGYRFRTSDLRRGVTPVAVVALDESGAEIDRQTTGFNG